MLSCLHPHPLPRKRAISTGFPSVTFTWKDLHQPVMLSILAHTFAFTLLWLPQWSDFSAPPPWPHCSARSQSPHLWVSSYFPSAIPHSRVLQTLGRSLSALEHLLRRPPTQSLCLSKARGSSWYSGMPYNLHDKQGQRNSAGRSSHMHALLSCSHLCAVPYASDPALMTAGSRKSHTGHLASPC